MGVVRSYADVETWTVKQLIDAALPEPVGSKKITIPEFQRRLVWSKDKQEQLILSIKSGYPFGSLLLYEDNTAGNQSSENKRFYKLIDGLQRTQALIKYTQMPNTFFNRQSIPDSFVEAVIREFGLNPERDEDMLRKTVEKWVRGLRGFAETDGWGVGDMTQMLVTELSGAEPESTEFYTILGRMSNNGLLRNELATFLREIREDADISEAKIPVIVYTGPASELPSVFELLNSQGTALSRYEIFAAQWIDKRESIRNKKIIDAIWKKYEALEDEGFTLDVSEEAPDSKSRRDREYSLFEYLFGLGQYLSSEYKYLFTKVAADRPSSGGFNLISACSGLNVKEMDKLPQQIADYDRAEFEEKMLTAVEFVNETLKPILEVSQKGRSSASIYHTEFQIISMIATTFVVRYRLEDLTEVDGWKSQWERLERHLPMYYLYDIVRDYWRGTGDTKLHENVQNLRYLKPTPSESYWRQVLETWFVDNQLTQAHVRRYVRDQTPEVLMLKYIYVHKFSIMQGAKRYHVEHLVPVEQLIEAMGENEKWPINAVGNLALLGEKENISKGSKTFKEDLDDRLARGKITVEQYDDLLVQTEQQLLCRAASLPDAITHESYEAFLIDRFDALLEHFIDVWRDYIPQDSPADSGD